MMSLPQDPVTYLEAIRLALNACLQADERVFIYGEDIEDPFGGAFKATKGLSTRYPGRVLNAPISEDAIAGIAVGAALDGMRPVIEFQFADFAMIAFNQLVNHAATSFWRQGQACPLVARLPLGGTPGGGPFHSQMVENWLTIPPGLITVAPATVADAYHMLRQAVRCDDPVMFCEHKALYFNLRDNIPAQPELPLGRAAVRRSGRDLTLVSYGAQLHDCLQAAERLAQERRIDVEVIDLRCLKPLDMETIYASLQRSGRLLLCTEAWPYGGVGAEVLAQVSDAAFHLLDAPPRRLSAEDVPVPFHPALWQAYRPHGAKIVSAALDLMRY